MYGAPPRPEEKGVARRPLLHAFRLAFDHPVTGERVAVESPPPEDFRRAIARLRRREG